MHPNKNIVHKNSINFLTGEIKQEQFRPKEYCLLNKDKLIVQMTEKYNLKHPIHEYEWFPPICEVTITKRKCEYVEYWKGPECTISLMHERMHFLGALVRKRCQNNRGQYTEMLADVMAIISNYEHANECMQQFKDQYKHWIESEKFPMFHQRLEVMEEVLHVLNLFQQLK